MVSERTVRRPPPGELSLVDPLFLSVKAGAAAGLALLGARLLHNPDLVTATFVAVLCVSPSVLAGLRRGVAQLLGSLVGGALGTAAALAGLPIEVGVPLAVASAIAASFGLGYPSGYAVAAFTALLVQVVPRGTPWETLLLRVEAVLLGAACAMLANLLLSAWLYTPIFARRMRALRDTVDSLLAVAVERGPMAVEPGFATVRALDGELRTALDELRFHPRGRAAPQLRAWLDEVEATLHLLHLVYDLGLAARSAGVPVQALAPLLRWLRTPEGPPPDAPIEVAGPASRAIALRESGPRAS